MSNKDRDRQPVYPNEPGSVVRPLQPLDLSDKCRGLGIVLDKLQPFGGQIKQRASVALVLLFNCQLDTSFCD